MIVASTSLSGNMTSKASNNSIIDFAILKAFNCTLHTPKALLSKEVIWHPPQLNWSKCNIDEASKGNPDISACGDIFRDYNSDVILCFSEPLGICSSYHDELCGFMRAIEIIHQNQWNNAWIESDSSLVVLVAKRSKLVPWSLRNRWNNVKVILNRLNCIIFHTYREGNQAADSLANHGLTLNSINFWTVVPNFISSSFIKDKAG